MSVTMLPQAGETNRPEARTEPLISQIAHDLRQPLSGIESIAHYLKLIVPAGDQILREQLDRLQKLVDQSHWILSNGLDMLQDAPFGLEDIDPYWLILDVVDGLELGEGEKIHLSLNPDLPLIRWNERELRSVLVNATELMRQSGGVRQATFLSATEIDGFCVLELTEPLARTLPSGADLSIANLERAVAVCDGDVTLTSGVNGLVLTIRVKSVSAAPRASSAVGRSAADSLPT